MDSNKLIAKILGLGDGFQAARHRAGHPGFAEALEAHGEAAAQMQLGATSIIG